MKKLLTLSCILLFIGIQQHTYAKDIRAYLSYTTFNSPETGPFIETYLSVVGSTVQLIQSENGKYQGAVEITMLFKQGEKIVDFAKYELNSPELNDTLNQDLFFLDQQRFALPNGDYEFEIKISDKNTNTAPIIRSEAISIVYPSDEISISGIQLVNSYKESTSESMISKSGYDLITNVTNFYPESTTRLTFYAELYNTNKYFGDNEGYVVSYFIESFETHKKFTQFLKIKRETSALVTPLFTNFDITQLPSGNYNLVIQIKNRANELVTENRLFFQRSNPNIQYDMSDIAALAISNTFVSKYTSHDTLAEYIKSLAPISTDIERHFAATELFNHDIKTMQQFFYNFWLGRNYANPYNAWIDYFQEVQKVNAAYSTQVKEGYETDRGRVYLQYGAPNSITESYSEPTAYPYEIWHYYTLKNGQRNKKFVFVTWNVTTNDFLLLHSNAIGELSNLKWQAELNRNIGIGYDIDATGPPDSWGSRANDLYTNPR